MDSSATVVLTETILVYGVSLPVLHIPRSLGWEQRCAALRAYLDEQQPRHVIFRFIPYSLNPKGIVRAAARWLPRVLSGRSLLWLMDEIWLGSGPTSFKHRLVGLIQRACILRLVRGVKPKRIYTNNRFNTRALRHEGVDAETLRLFGNIPLVGGDRGVWLQAEFVKAGVPITATNRGQWLVLGNFGLFHSDWQPDAFLSTLRDLSKQLGKSVCFVGIGSLGSYANHWQAVAKTWGGDFTFLHLGRRSDVEVSLFLQSVDFGITTNPYYLVGKSGTCMAMLDHGLPIIIPRISEVDDLTELPAELVIRCGDEVGDWIFAERIRHVPDPQLPRAVDKLVAAMAADQ